MRPVSPEFLKIVRGSHRMCARARVVPPGQTGVDPEGTEVPILGGDVELDATADIRSTLKLITDPSWWPKSADDMLAPYGMELFVERGIVHGNGDREWVSQGYFRIDSVEQDNAPRGAVEVSGSDRMVGIIDDRPLAPMVFGPGTSVSSMFDFLVTDVYQNAQIVYDFDAGGKTFPSSHVLEDDRHGFLLDLARSLGKIMFWDHEGKLQVRDAPDPGDPVFDVTHGEGGVLVEMSRALTRDGVWNAVVATGEQVGEESPVRAVAFDLNPESPTYWQGSYGKVPRFYSSPFITTEAQAQSAADAMLARSIGLPHELDLDAVPNPALEPLDPVRISYDDRERSEVHVLESLTIPLVATDGMSAKTKVKITGGASG